MLRGTRPQVHAVTARLHAVTARLHAVTTRLHAVTAIDYMQSQLNYMQSQCTETDLKKSTSHCQVWCVCVCVCVCVRACVCAIGPETLTAMHFIRSATEFIIQFIEEMSHKNYYMKQHMFSP